MANKAKTRRNYKNEVVGAGIHEDRVKMVRPIDILYTTNGLNCVLNKLRLDHKKRYKKTYKKNSLYMAMSTITKVCQDFRNLIAPTMQDKPMMGRAYFDTIRKLEAYINSYYAKIQLEPEQLLDIYSRLEQLRMKWNVRSKEQAEVLYGNLLEELTELARAKDINERIDAYLDICVFLINATDKFHLERVFLKYNPLDSKDALHQISSFCINYFEPTNSERHSTSGDIFLFCLEQVYTLGYHPILCFNEVLKELESRQQDPEQRKRWNQMLAKGLTINEKFMKDKTKPTYKANFDECKLPKKLVENQLNPYYRIVK